MTDEISIADFPRRTLEKIRYADTDRQGHVNNAVFATLLEAGRVELFYDPAAPLVEAGSAFVIARLEIDFRAEIQWPGVVEIGTRVASIGRSSVRLEQGLFQAGRCVGVGVTVVVLMDEATRRSRPLPESARERLSRCMAGGSG